MEEGINLIGWVWAFLALLFIVAEIFTAGLVMICFGIGAAVASVLAFLGLNLVWQLVGFTAVAALLQTWKPDALVLGVPTHPDGAAHENTARALKFARQLRGRFGLPVFEVDERYSTTEAHSLGATDADAASACIILEQFLRSLP